MTAHGVWAISGELQGVYPIAIAVRILQRAMQGIQESLPAILDGIDCQEWWEGLSIERPRSGWAMREANECSRLTSDLESGGDHMIRNQWYFEKSLTWPSVATRRKARISRQFCQST